MLLEILLPLSSEFSPLRLFQYLTFRSGGALMTALIVGLVLGPATIRWLKQRQAEGQPIRDDGPESHFRKRGTPTMGGVLILLSVALSTLLWMDLGNGYVWSAVRGHPPSRRRAR